MQGHRDAVIAAVDEQISELARMSQEMDQETRVTVVIFDDNVDVLIYDKDVLRLPSIREYYEPRGRTALVDATLLALDDLSDIPEKYADHAFMAVCLTDGMENASKNKPSTLSQRVSKLPDNWTVAALVPDARGENYAQKCGFPPGNIAIWDASSSVGFDQAASTIQRATETFMRNRAAGIRSSTSVFSTGADTVNKESIQAADLKPLSPKEYVLVPVTRDAPVKAWVEEECGRQYRVGKAYYELMKTETIQGNKALAVVEKSTGSVFTGDSVRGILGLGRTSVRVKPDHNEQYKIFVQSTSVNRKLKAGTQLLLMN
ncbi:hypothetical protein [Streptomyces sp. TP-A0874]|uniref:hypothetical protein n=1 Tax=Streptomyces sp. TP-A0874 TaxID=549819 RepID=UPI000853D554|nr:hypothetical protein [Streptomyces sp. TP-A0874]